MSLIKIDDKDLIFECPHCHHYVLINKNEINCKIFRHAAYKMTLTSINPHAKKEECDTLVSSGLVYGCAKPFMLNIDQNGTFSVVECGYI